VRSSATAEDSAAASFAGVHASFLGVKGLEGVLRAIRGCYASLWTPRAVAYRRHQGLADDAVDCAVVICALVTGPEQSPPVAAGWPFRAIRALDSATASPSMLSPAGVRPS
jgi:phosphoenolpyruvate synthase/pyruvate phosphate dikinase